PVESGTRASYGARPGPAPALLTAHASRLAGLGAATLYHFRVKSRDAVGNLATSADFSFRTAVTAPPPAGGRGPLALWSLDEGTGMQVADSSGNGYNGLVLNGGAWTAGRLGQALSFDGANAF